MSDRYQILDDKEFWTRLEFNASHLLESSEDKTLRRFWIDGFLPDSIKNTKRGVDVEGMAWVGEGPREQHEYRFAVSVPQRMVHHRRGTFSIERIILNEAQQTLEIEIANEKQAA